MKKLFVILSATFLLLLSSAISLNAAQDKANINISTRFVDYLNFTGTAINSTKYYTIDDVSHTPNSRSGTKLSLGTLGVESNSIGDCDIHFTAKNNFRLRHTVSNQRLANYRLLWKGNVMSGNSARTNKLTIPCNSTAETLSFQTVAYFNPNPQEGLYQDIVTVTVTTQ